MRLSPNMEIPFDKDEYSERYVFKGKRVYHRTRNPGKPIRPHVRTNADGYDYSYYFLTRNDGVRVKVSAAIITGKVERVGNVWQLAHFPKGWEARPGFPSYIFHRTKAKVRRVGFLTPRHRPVDIKPNKVGKYRLHTPEGYRWFHHDDLF